MQSMSSSKLARPDVFLVSASTIVIIFAIVITATVQNSTVQEPTAEKAFSQVITVGPVWPTNMWSCTSDADYIVHAVLTSYGTTPSHLEIKISGQGGQPDLEFTPFKMETFSVGGRAGSTMTISSIGEISGYITLQTLSNANARCASI